MTTTPRISHTASPTQHPGKRLRRAGLTLIECMILVTVISIISVAAGVGMQSVVKIPAQTDSIMAVNSVLVSVMEQAEASLDKSWPASTTFTPTILVGASSYAPTITINNTAYAYGTPPTYTSLTNALLINNNTYQLSMAVDQADPAGGTTYKSTFLQVTVAVTPYVNGSLATSGMQKVVTYVSKQ